MNAGSESDSTKVDSEDTSATFVNDRPRKPAQKKGRQYGCLVHTSHLVSKGLFKQGYLVLFNICRGKATIRSTKKSDLTLDDLKTFFGDKLDAFAAGRMTCPLLLYRGFLAVISIPQMAAFLIEVIRCLGGIK